MENLPVRQSLKGRLQPKECQLPTPLSRLALQQACQGTRQSITTDRLDARGVQRGDEQCE